MAAKVYCTGLLDQNIVELQLSTNEFYGTHGTHTGMSENLYLLSKIDHMTSIFLE